MPVDYSNWDAFEDSDASDSEDEPMTEAEIRAESDRVARESVEANEMLKLRYPNGTDDDVEFPPKHLDEETRKKLMEMQPGGEKVLQAARDFKKKLKADREAGNDPRRQPGHSSTIGKFATHPLGAVINYGLSVASARGSLRR